jgi:hypothetical protein
MTVRRSNADRALALLDWGMDPKHRGKSYTKAQMAAGIGMGCGTTFDRVCGAARDLAFERGWCFAYFHPRTDGSWVAAFTKTDAKLPIPGVAQRTSALAKQTTNVRKQVEFVRRHSPRDSVARHIARIVEMTEANTIETHALLRSVMDRMTEDDD